MEHDIRAAADGLFLKREELRAVRNMGWSIGAHTVSHRCLNSLDEAEQVAEINQSKRELEELLGDRVDGFAYPFGGVDAYDTNTERLARDAGYRVAFALRPKVVLCGSVNRWAIPRFSVGQSDTMSLLRSRLELARLFGRRESPRESSRA